MSNEKWIKEHRKEIREYKLKWYKKNKKKAIAKVRKYKKDNARWFREFKETLKCNRCPESDRRCLDFHHKDPKEKIAPVSILVARGCSRKTIIKEIKKCEVICSNCHRKETRD